MAMTIFGRSVRKGEAADYRAMKRVGAGRLLRKIERYAAPGRLLDVGSGLGDLLALAGRRGWDAWGVEPNAWAVERAEEVAPGRTFYGDLDKCVLAEEPAAFDAVTCLDVIEHLRRPLETLEMIRHCLRPGGLLAATTPNTDSWLRRWQGAKWVHFHVDHLWYFNRPSLTALAHRAGLEVLRCGPAWKTFTAKYLLSVFANSERGGWLSRMARCGLRWLPRGLAGQCLPPLCEGLFLLARRPEPQPDRGA
jgi:SAM-dependent methyltransferase